VDLQYSSLCLLVLDVGCRWPAPARSPKLPHGWSVSLPADVLDPQLRREMGEEQWRPGFVDYLFLAYNTSTAFSPTDVPVLSRWAKVLMMVQATISLATVALLAARAVNIL